MNKSRIHSLAAILWFSSTVAMAQQPMMEGMKDMPIEKTDAGKPVYTAKGEVIKIDAQAGVVTIAHEPIQSLKWPAMTMGFQVMDKMLLNKLSVGSTIDFELSPTDKGYVITRMK